jgi:hypothetical protein
MKWYWLVTNDNTVKNPFVSDTGDLEGFEKWIFADCKAFKDWSEKAWVGANKPGNDGDPDDSLQNHFGLLIFSAQLRIALEEAGIGGIQYLPIQVLRPTGSRIEGYCIINILNCVKAFDLGKTIHSRYPMDYFLPERRGELSSVRQVTLRSNQLKGHDIIRPEEYKVKVYVSGRFKEVFENNRFSGLSFHDVNIS